MTTIKTISKTGKLLTSQFKELHIETDSSKVTIAFANGDNTFFEAEYYVYDQEVVLYEPGSIIEEYMREASLWGAHVTITCEDSSMEVDFYYCEYVLPDTFLYEDNFRSALAAQRVHANSIIHLAHVYNSSYDSVGLKAVGLNADGTLTVTNELQPWSMPEEGFLKLQVADIIALVTDSDNAEELGEVLSTVRYFAISYANSSKIFFLTDEPEYYAFQFVNIFNIPEVVDIDGYIQANTKTERSTAICGGILKPYDMQTTREYSMKTAPLELEEAKALDQLLNSREIQLLYSHDSSIGERIIITDHTCEIDNSNESLATIEFTWQFAWNRVHLFGDDLSAFVNTSDKDSGRIFTDSYTREYN